MRSALCALRFSATDNRLRTRDLSYGAHAVEGRTNGGGEIIAMVGQDAVVVAIGD